MRSQAAACLLALALASTTPAGRAAAADTYRDDQGRFEVDLPAGWRYSPATTNLRGAMFRGGHGSAEHFVSGAVEVMPFSFPVGLATFSARVLDSFSQEPGFRWRQQERPCRVAGHPGRCRSFFVDGPAAAPRLVRLVQQQLVVFEQVGYVAHCEAKDADQQAFEAECKAFFAGLRLQDAVAPQVRRQRRAAPIEPEALVGRWQSGQHALRLTPGFAAQLDGQAGTWRLSGGVLILNLGGHDAVYEVELGAGRLTLRGGPFGAGQVFVPQPG